MMRVLPGFVGLDMNDDFYKQQTQRIRDLAERADPFTRKRLLDLADKYDVKAGKPSRATRMVERPLPEPRKHHRE
jgi:hypothetical protein